MQRSKSESADNISSTQILDYTSRLIQTIFAKIEPKEPKIEFLRSAHRYIRQTVAPIYTLNELQPTSVTFQKRVGSCSQRMACLESLARANNIETRVKALWISGKFWNQRFPFFIRPFIPKTVLLVWPQFRVRDSQYIDFSEIFQPLPVALQSFTNSHETLFEGVENHDVQFTSCNPGCSNLSRFLIKEDGFYNSRDAVFDKFGIMHKTLRGQIFEILYKRVSPI